MKILILLSVIVMLTVLSNAEEPKKPKKNKINLGNINIGSDPDNLFQISDKFIINGDGSVGINTLAPAATLDVSGDLTTAGNITAGGAIKLGETVISKNMLKISGVKSGFISFVTPSNAGATTYTLPSTDGKPGEFLTTNGSGTLTWSTLRPYRFSCPADFSLIGTSDTSEVFCISTVQEAPSTWLKAIANCYSKSVKARLCTASEWAMSCVSENAKKMTGHWEWVADSGSNYGRIIGLAGCDSFNGASVDTLYPSRCCFR